MNAELLAVLDHMEREKGVARSILIEAIEAALVSAAHKVLPEKETEVIAKIDPETGEMLVTSNGKKVASSEFGRIAAQTAKQVIIQKIRDAERDVIHDEFAPKLNTIISGTVFRYDKGTVIVDLGKTEAILPKREQSPRDAYRQGDRVRVFLIEVSKTPKGPQIIVSRNNPGLVKKLFEIEVPEVLDAIVEIKGVSREAGDRSKIAVWSKDEKVDCVGACVGMRGSRVKNIVRELQGEKIDIVRWNENITEYVRAALSPAECAVIEVRSHENKRVRVIVEDDQLSLAIGKSGQNVRLASKLTGWNIDIHSQSDLANMVIVDERLGEVGAVNGVTKPIAAALKEQEIESIRGLSEMTTEDLARIDGVDEERAAKISESSRMMLGEETAKLKEENKAKAEEKSKEAAVEAEAKPEADKVDVLDTSAVTGNDEATEEEDEQKKLLEQVKSKLLSDDETPSETKEETLDGNSEENNEDSKKEDNQDG